MLFSFFNTCPDLEKLSSISFHTAKKHHLQHKLGVTFVKMQKKNRFNKSHYFFSLFLTFGNAECVVATGHKVIERDKQVGVILAGSCQQVLFGVPAGRFCQTLTLEVWSLQSF